MSVDVDDSTVGWVTSVPTWVIDTPRMMGWSGAEGSAMLGHVARTITRSSERLRRFQIALLTCAVINLVQSVAFAAEIDGVTSPGTIVGPA
jgi:hypothetical protein